MIHLVESTALSVRRFGYLYLYLFELREWGRKDNEDDQCKGKESTMKIRKYELTQCDLGMNMGNEK